MTETLEQSPLISKTAYISQYSPELLFPIPRIQKRLEIGIKGALPFSGFDVWNAYELSWLNAKGKPQVAIAEFIFPCDSPNMIESKSFKLYLNSFNNTGFCSVEDVVDILQEDLSEACSAPIQLKLQLVNFCRNESIEAFSGICIDDLDVECSTYTLNPDYLSIENELVTETLYSDLLKSNCLVTHQPDWGSVQISYTGKKINPEGLLKYIVSFRDHNEFHEQCVERIFTDIMKKCSPKKLTVEARYTRRGGLDINPIRSTETIKSPKNIRLCRQ